MTERRTTCLQSIRGNIHHEEWRVLLRYARRVRKIRYINHLEETIRRSVFETLLERLQGRPLFPNLQVLHWGSKSSKNTLKILTNSPRLSVVILKDTHRLYLWHQSPTLNRTLSTISSSSVALQELFVQGSSETLDNFVATPACQNLERVVLDTYISMDTTLFSNLASLKSLRSLSISARIMEHGDDIRIEPKVERTEALVWASPFPALDRVAVKAEWGYHREPERVLSPLFSLLSASPITMAEIKVSSWATLTSSAFSVLNHLCAGRMSQSLRTLRLHFKGDDWRADDGGRHHQAIRFKDSIDPLLALQRIEELRLGVVSWWIDISDADVAKMAAAWPHLTFLHIEYDPPEVIRWQANAFFHHAAFSYSQKRPSILSLVDLAERCERLEELALCAEDITEHELRALEDRAAGYRTKDGSVTTHDEPPLQRLHLTNGTHFQSFCPRHVKRLARVLHSMLPRMEGGGAPFLHRPSSPDHQEWKATWTGYEGTTAYEFQVELDELQLEAKDTQARN